MHDEEQHEQPAEAAGQAELLVGADEDRVAAAAPGGQRRLPGAGGRRHLRRDRRHDAAAVVALRVLDLRERVHRVAEHRAVRQPPQRRDLQRSMQSV